MNLANKEHEQVVICSDPKTGLKAIIAIHNTTLGPALGGTRMWNYESEEAAMKDVLRLSRGMTYKSAISGLNLGGGKAVIIGDSHTEKTEALFRSFGRFVDSLGGRYITAEDVGNDRKGNGMDLLRNQICDRNSERTGRKWESIAGYRVWSLYGCKSLHQKSLW
ncbi:MAG: Glu/Leu/Phe/Val dehydrogenase dimerization domain-containing protein [Gracilimonas sp.]|nr:Glu/Leu/Phe/Val dehydrogenase dimerization domain-containing protein [Gracilimonas sp.]